MDYKKVENLSNGEWVLTEIKKEYGNYLGFHRNLPPGTLCPAFRVDVPPFSLAETEEELLEELKANLDQGQNQTDHIGIYNVHKRIRLVYGSRYGVGIDSKIEEGTVVTLRVPCEE